MIRKAIINDAEQLSILNTEFNDDGKTTIENIRNCLVNNCQEVVIVDDEKGELTGFVCVQLKKSFCYDNYRPEISEVYVRPEYRRRKIASRMILFAEEYCEKIIRSINSNSWQAKKTLSLNWYITDSDIKTTMNFICQNKSNNKEFKFDEDENMRIENKLIRIRDFAESDLPLMLKWLTDDRVLEYYEGRDVRFTMNTLAAHFLEEIPDGFRVIIEYEDQAVGYSQAYQLSGELFEEYDYPDNGKVVYAMDQFIGEPDYWNRGIGSAFLQMMATYLKTCKGAACILLDPHKNNYRAIRAYEKAGFRIIQSLPEHELHEGKMEDCWLMEREL